MKKINTVLKFIILPLILTVIIGFNFYSDSEVNTGIKAPGQKSTNYAFELVSKAGNDFEKVSLFTISAKDNSKALNEFAETASFLTLNENKIKSLYSANKKNILLTIPLTLNESIELELVQENIFMPGFDISSKDGKKINYKPGLYYYGIIKGDNKSVVSVSIFENSIMGIISNDEGNYVLGTIKDDRKNPTNEYIFYNDNNLKIKNNFKCDVEDYYGKHYIGSTYKHSAGPKDVMTQDTLRLSFVADYQTYVDNGSNVTQLVNFISGMFASVRLIYRNEGIPMGIAQIQYYNQTDPYASLSSSGKILLTYGGNTQEEFLGDLSHLLSTGHGQQLGGIAWVNVLCQSFNPADSSGRYGFSNIADTYIPYPSYSWTVNVVAHELGHNIGSMHTHACVWPVFAFGGIGAIDSCHFAEGNCFSGTRPKLNGTIMSYCHLDGTVNLAAGFGQLPGDTIRLGYSLAACLDSALNSSELPVVYNLLQNYPNPFNPSTTITFALPSDGYVTLTVYDITGREVVKLVNNQFYQAGIFKSFLNTGEFNMASGVYLYKLDVNKNNSSVYSQIKKMVLLK